MHIKTILVKNPKNVLVQIPGFVVASWNLKKGDGVDMNVTEDGTVIITPKTQNREHVDRPSEGLAE